MKIAYKPFGIVVGIVAGILSRRLFDVIWSKIDDDDPPGAKTEDASWTRVVTAAAVQGLTFSVTRAVVDRAGARGFEHLFGIWPGEKEPKHKG